MNNPSNIVMNNFINLDDLKITELNWYLLILIIYSY